jgi:hypothetical protein
VNLRGVIKWIAITAVVAVLAFVALSVPRMRSLPEGYSYAHFPLGGHRYLMAPGGIKMVGQEVLDYHVAGTIVTGTVRLMLEHDDVRMFCLDLKTNEVTLGDRVQNDAR